jgi:hypothetical protein
MMSELDKQVGGNHYKQFGDHQPVRVIMAWGLNWLAGNAVKYLSRYQHKGTALQDLEKARHYIDMEIERLRNEE